MRENNGSLRLFIVMPVYNDWDSAKIVIEQIDHIFQNISVHIQILIVNDGSSIPFPPDFIQSPPSSISGINLLHLRRNLGHQRAIAIALTYLFESKSCDAVIIMDADGEDRPEDIPSLLDQYQNNDSKRVIFAERTKRMEGPLFKIGYFCYQILHKILTGHSVRVGNFSIIPFNCLSQLVVSSQLWKHYAASIYELNIPYSMLPTPRGKRIRGNSKMNFTSLVIHGLSAISVFSEIVGTRILFAACLINTILMLSVLSVITIHFFTTLYISIWAMYGSFFLLIIFLQILATAGSFLLFVLSSKNMSSFLPLRDYSIYIHNIQQVFQRDE